MKDNIFNTPMTQRAMRKHEARLNEAAAVAKAHGKDFGFEKKLATAVALENTAKHIRATEAVQYGSATQPNSIGQYKRFAMDMVATTVPNLIAYDLVSVQPIDNRVGMVNYLQFTYGSNKGATKAGDVYSSALGFNGSDSNYTAAMVTDEALVTGADTHTLAWGPVRPGSVVIKKSTGEVVTSGFTVDYDAGTITGYTAAEGDVVDYAYDNESVPVKAPTLTMNIQSLPITTTSRKLTAVWAFDAGVELQKEYGEDISTILATQASAEIAYEIDREITGDLLRASGKAPQIVWSKTAPIGIALSEHYDSFWTKVVEGSNIIFGRTNRVRANFMVCGLGVSAVLQTSRNFESSNDTTSVGPHFIGTLGGTIKCYVDPSYPANDFVLGYKGPSMIDTGYIYAPYLPIVTTDMVMLDDFAARKGWATTYGKKVVNPNLYVHGAIVD